MVGANICPFEIAMSLYNICPFSIYFTSSHTLSHKTEISMLQIPSAVLPANPRGPKRWEQSASLVGWSVEWQTSRTPSSSRQSRSAFGKTRDIIKNIARSLKKIKTWLTWNHHGLYSGHDEFVDQGRRICCHHCRCSTGLARRTDFRKDCPSLAG